MEAEELDNKDTKLGFTPNSSHGVKGTETENQVSKGYSKLWVDIIRGTRETTKEKEIKFVAPNIMNGEVEVEMEMKISHLD